MFFLGGNQVSYQGDRDGRRYQARGRRGSQGREISVIAFLENQSKSWARLMECGSKPNLVKALQAEKRRDAPAN